MSCIKPPSFMTYETHLNCNYNCKMCARQYFDFEYNETWSWEKLISVMDKTPWASNQIGGNNEPTIYPHFFEYLGNNHIRGFQNMFTTNGSTLTEENMMNIPPKAAVYISIDGATEKSYQDIRGHELAPILRNVQMLRQKRPDLNLTIHHILFKNRILEARNLVDFSASLGINLRAMLPIMWDKDFEIEYSPFRGRAFDKDLMELMYYGKVLGLDVSQYASPVMKERPCMVPWSSPVVANNGDVYPCCYSYIKRSTNKPEWTTYYLDHEIKVPQYQYSMGNLFTENFMVLWRGEKWQGLRNKLTVLNEEANNNVTNKDPEMRFEALLDKYAPNTLYDFCSVCLSRWGRSE